MTDIGGKNQKLTGRISYTRKAGWGYIFWGVASKTQEKQQSLCIEKIQEKIRFVTLLMKDRVEEIETLREIQALRRLNKNGNIIQLEEVIL